MCYDASSGEIDDEIDEIDDGGRWRGGRDYTTRDQAMPGDVAALQQAWRDTQPGEAAVAEPRRALSELQNWQLDTQGYIILEAVATRTELSEQAALARHPVLEAYAEDLCGIGYRLDQPVRDVAESTYTSGRMVGGDSRTRDPAREYFHSAGYILTEDNQQGFTEGYTEHVHVRQCQGLLAVWALADIDEGAGFALVPCSHLADVEPPVCLNQGEDLAGPLSVIAQPAMRGESRSQYYAFSLVFAALPLCGWY